MYVSSYTFSSGVIKAVARADCRVIRMFLFPFPGVSRGNSVLGFVKVIY